MHTGKTEVKLFGHKHKSSLLIRDKCLKIVDEINVIYSEAFFFYQGDVFFKTLLIVRYYIVQKIEIFL